MKVLRTLVIYTVLCIALVSQSVVRVEASDVVGGWTRLEDSPAPLRNSVTFVWEGKIYVLNDGSVTTEQRWFRVYDPNTNEWDMLSTPPVSSGWYTTIAVLDGVAYAITTSGFYKYHIATDTWAYIGALSTGEFPRPNNNLMVGSATTVAGKLYFMGKQRTGPTTFTYNNLFTYSPSNNTWTELAQAPFSLDKSEVMELDGKLYAVGGLNWVGTVGQGHTGLARYDPKTNIWTTLTSHPIPSGGIHNHGAAVVNGKIYVVADRMSSAAGRLDIYDPKTSLWTSGIKPPVATSPTVAECVNGKLYIVTYGDIAPLGVQTYVYTPSDWIDTSTLMVTFDANGGITPSFPNKVVTRNKAYGELPVTTKRGYDFLGWNCSKTISPVRRLLSFPHYSILSLYERI